ncbi:hypothetical protein Tco_0770517 [Tanacetum coccineum]|uniref:Uncharacterized protein n=1 Tax=Tanacetum coccineum TaxID=301880 RepID=A0ABQ4ZEE7_9ASTR
MEDLIEVSDAKITIRSSLGFLRDVKKKLEEPGNEKRNTLFRATVFDKWLDIPAFANDNLLLNYIFHHQVSAEPSVDCPPITYSICGNSFEFGRKEFCLITGFLFGKLPKKETYKGIPSSIFLDRIFPDRCTNRVKKVKGDDLMLLFTTDDLWFGISDHDAVRTDSVGEVLVPDVEQEQNLICLIVDTADETSQLDLNIHSDDHVQDLNSTYQDIDKDSNIHCKDHVEEQNSPFQDMDKESNIHSHDTVKQQTSLNMCKEHVLAEFDAIKATTMIGQTAHYLMVQMLRYGVDMTK